MRVVFIVPTVLLILIGFDRSSSAQDERYYSCAFKDASQASRKRPRGTWSWRHPLTLGEEVSVSVFGTEAYVSFKTFELEGEVIAGDTYDPFVNEFIIRGRGTFTRDLNVQDTSVTILISDVPGGITAAFSYLSKSNNNENLTIATGSCSKLYE
jgi:hypothetical protein